MNLPESGYTPLNLKTFMVINKLSIKDVATRLNVCTQTVFNWRYGRATMPHEQWLKLTN